jgi:hypothetical protein
MMAVQMPQNQNQFVQTPQNQNQYNTFSAAAAVAPIVLWSGATTGQGNVYLAAKNTFLEFYTDEKKAIKRNACARSASCDSSFKADSSFNTTASRSASPSSHSLLSSDCNGTQSPHQTPRSNHQQYDRRTGNNHQQYHIPAPAEGYSNYSNNNYHEQYDRGCGASMQGPSQGGQTMMMVPMMMPMNAQSMMMMPVNAQEVKQEPVTVNPQTKSDRLPSKKQDLKDLEMEPVDEITTLMVRGIPCSFSQDVLMKIIDQAGMKGRYDFFYLPRAGNNGSNLGYAFINFTDGAGADQMMATFNGVPLDPSRSTKICTISQADIQGLGNLRKHFRRTAVSRGSRGPVFLKVFSEDSSASPCDQASQQ